MIKAEREKIEKKVVERYNKGELVRFIAVTTGFSTQHINKILDKHEVVKRDDRFKDLTSK